MPPDVRRFNRRPHFSFCAEYLSSCVGRSRDGWGVVSGLQPVCWACRVMGPVSVLGKVWLLYDDISCASSLFLALQSSSAPPHQNTDFQWLGCAPFFLQLKAHFVLVPRLAVAMLAPVALRTVSSFTTSSTTTSAVFCPAFELLHEGSIGVGR